MSFAQVADRKALRPRRRGDSIRTPQSLWHELDREFHFTCDVAASEENALCNNFYSEWQDGLAQTWNGVCFCNPPYSDITPWVEKAAEEQERGTTTVMLLPARTDMGWWHDYVLPRALIRYIRGRLRFEGEKAGAPFPSVVVIFLGLPTDVQHTR